VTINNYFWRQDSRHDNYARSTLPKHSGKQTLIYQYSLKPNIIFTHRLYALLYVRVKTVSGHITVSTFGADKFLFACQSETIQLPHQKDRC
jgi:hypothetical protein